VEPVADNRVAEPALAPVAELGLAIVPAVELAQPIVPVAVPEQPMVLVVELGIVLEAELETLIVLATERGTLIVLVVELGLAIVLVAERPIDPVAVRAPSQPVVQVAAGTASGAAMYLIARAAARSVALRVEETEAQLALVVTEALAAWAAAAAADAVAGGAGDRQSITKEKQMKSKLSSIISLSVSLFASAILLSCFAGTALPAAQPAKPDAAATSQAKQRGFDTPQQATDSLIQSAETFDVPALEEILGPGSEDILTSQDPVMDKNRAVAFAAKARENNSIEVDKKNSSRAIVSVGIEEWPLPIPIVKRKGKWYFDTKAGREEILFRRIGTNELDAIEICRGYVDAQEEYSEEKHDGSTVNQYAQRIISTPGKQDGLAWKNPDGTWGGPVGEDIAKALEQGYTDKSQPYHGYYFKILKGQGPAAPMGQMDFVVKDAMIGGYALAAAPADYRVTGVQTFIVGPTGIVYQKDLGPDTLKAFKEMERFNPDKTWHRTDDDWENEQE
jgi:hypothetical protein